ncbi:MAG TPA: VOC family protein [Hanamia sp.]|nr:VOC family protein [Hanamia sp.]
MKIPENYQTIMPYLILDNAAGFLAFTQRVFGATEKIKAMRNENQIMHAEVMIGQSTIMFADSIDRYKLSNANLFVYVENADETYRSALQNGGSVVTQLSNQSYGRSGGIKDPFGNVWWITSVI